MVLSYQKTASYARALFDIPGSVEEIQRREQDLGAVADLVRQEPKLLTLLSFSDLTVEKKLALLEEFLQKKLDVCVRHLLACIIQRRKTTSIRQIALEYHRLVVHHLKEVEVLVTSAFPLNEEEKQTIQAKLEKKWKKKVRLLEALDPSLLGGFTLLVYNDLLDLSIKEKINKLKKQLFKAEL